MDPEGAIRRIESVTRSGFYSAATFRAEEVSPATALGLEKAGYELAHVSGLLLVAKRKESHTGGQLNST